MTFTKYQGVTTLFFFHKVNKFLYFKKDSSKLENGITVLNSNDPIYKELRDLHVVHWGNFLTEKMLNIDGIYKNFKETQHTMSMRELKEFTEKLPLIQYEHSCVSLRKF